MVVHLFGHALQLNPLYMGEERRNRPDTEDLRKFLAENWDGFTERRGPLPQGPGSEPGGGYNVKAAAIVFAGGIALAQGLNFLNSRVLENAFSREPVFTAEWKESITAKLLRYELVQQSQEIKMARLEDKDQSQESRMMAFERKLDALLWKAGIDPNTLDNRR